MANRHFGNIGDIWKHLPLAEILALELPHNYWESHAGSASYPLVPSPERAYGVSGFLERAGRREQLAGSRFSLLLDDLAGKSPTLDRYPGSPLIAMMTLGAGASYLFCDLDGASLLTLEESARSLGIAPGHVRCVARDGVATVLQAASRLSRAEAAQTLVLIDPFDLELPPGGSPAGESAAGPGPVELLWQMATLGARAILWYGFDSSHQRQARRERIMRAFSDPGGETSATSLWVGEISLRSLDRTSSACFPGLGGCGIACANLSEEAIATCSELGRELAASYEDAVLPSGGSGALDFSSLPQTARPAW